MIKWVGGIGIAIASLLVTAFITLYNKVDDAPAAQSTQSAPIIIQVPAYQAPAAPVAPSGQK
jgi:hypothetical protein